MKTLLNLVIPACLFTLLFSCNSAVKFTTLKPAIITVPDSTKTIAFVNRTKPSKNGWNIAESIFTGEGLGQDENAVNKVMASLQSRFTDRTAFTLVKVNEIFVGNRSGAKFPVPFTWSEVDSIAKNHGADLIISLEIFDSDFSKFNKSDVIDVKTSTGIIKRTVYYPYERIKVYTGFRVYDPANQQIIDQHFYQDQREWMASSKPGVRLYNSNKNYYIDQLSERAGEDYGSRFLPSLNYCRRKLYKTKCAPIKDGTKMANLEQWDSARDKWNEVVNDPNATSEDKGKAAYNLAVAFEKKGDLEEAKKWAEEAKKYGNKDAVSYCKILTQRETEQKLLRKQMSNEFLLK